MTTAAPFAGCASALTVDEACRAIADELLICGVELPSVYLLVGQRLRCRAARGYFQVVDGFLPGTGIIGRAVAAAETVVVRDVRQDADFIGAMERVVGEIAVAVVLDGTAIGAVNAESTGPLPQEWLPVVDAAAQALAQRIGELGGLEPESLMQRVAKVAVEMTTQIDSAALEQVAVRAAAELSRMESALIARRLDGTHLEVTAVHGPQSDVLGAFADVELKTLAGWVNAGTSSHYLGMDAAQPSYDFLARPGLRSLAVYPLITGGDPSGILAVADTEHHPHHAEVIEALEMLAALAATGLGTVRTVDDLRRQATQDALTSCGNVSAFNSDLDAALRGLPRDHQVACLMIDVDHFKQVNDTYGHPVGDLLLQDLARAIRPVLRVTDRLYRVGGDEFAVIAFVVDAAHATQLAERVVRAARTMGTTVSVGVSCGSTGTPVALRSSADDALYQAKRAAETPSRLSHPRTTPSPACRRPDAAARLRPVRARAAARRRSRRSRWRTAR